MPATKRCAGTVLSAAGWLIATRTRAASPAVSAALALSVSLTYTSDTAGYRGIRARATVNLSSRESPTPMDVTDSFTGMADAARQNARLATNRAPRREGIADTLSGRSHSCAATNASAPEKR